MSAPVTIRSRVGYTVEGDNRYFGHGAISDLLGRQTFTGLMAMAVTARPVSDELRGLLDDISVIITASDPRVWPLKITRVVASYGGVIAAYAAGQLCLEGDRLGPPITRYAAEMLLELRARMTSATDGEAAMIDFVRARMKEGGRFIGFGVPFRPIDERMVALREIMRKRGRDRLPFWQLQLALVDIVQRERGIGPNVGIGLAAACLDAGLAPREMGTLLTMLNANCFVANAVEGAAQAPEVLRKLPDEAIEYVGVPPRESPRARSSG